MRERRGWGTEWERERCEELREIYNLGTEWEKDEELNEGGVRVWERERESNKGLNVNDKGERLNEIETGGTNSERENKVKDWMKEGWETKWEWKDGGLNERGDGHWQKIKVDDRLNRGVGEEIFFNPYQSVRPYAWNKWRAAKQTFIKFDDVVKCEPSRM